MAELDVELLISVAAGLGRWVEDRKTGQAVYSKDRDCLGPNPLPSHCSYRQAARWLSPLCDSFPAGR